MLMCGGLVSFDVRQNKSSEIYLSHTHTHTLTHAAYTVYESVCNHQTISGLCARVSLSLSFVNN